MRIAAFFTACVECDLQHCSAEYVCISVECTATWNEAECDADFSDLRVTGWDGEGVAPTWDALSRRDRGFAMDALCDACSLESVRREANAFPFVQLEGVA